MKPKTVCFDLGGVLVKICTDWNAALGRDFGAPAWGIDEPAIFAQYQSGQVERPEYVQQLASHLGTSEAHALAAHQRILIEPYEGTLELVLELKARGVITGCLSNTNELHWIEMTMSQRFPAITHLDHRIASHVVGFSKPQKEIFETFERVSESSSSEIVFFDDTASNVSAAHSFGWHAVLIDPNGDTASQMRGQLQTFDLL